jgi:peptidoglycan/xylan/chitin deacetylase (PgdA/CDA1 family)
LTTHVSLSFDDGHPLDLRLAKLLKRYGLRATFYIPLANRENPVLGPSGIRRLRDLGFEIGSHGLTHERVHQMPELEARREFYLSRRSLERILEEPVRGFCFSGGKTRKPLAVWVAQEGYDYCRSTRMFRQQRMRVRNVLHSSLQWYPHGTVGYLRHLMRRPRWIAFSDFLRHQRPSLAKRAESLFDEALQKGLPFHLWGHSYDLVEPRQWHDLEAFLDHIAGRPGVTYATNGELYDALLHA